ncbi:hypothetical protein [Rubellicoccus peritrichatus]|uniref:Uncharacterized protein n=1 Tax=Rubellicoccus peritrichatus TaxID=3080537 RepID=A0AAQ3L8B4_9BACT|nr:hypothetical protein [Puniceicoccus sp. CR14]WOO41165.1 hypothetical protein RZN69_21300 [Puniceicoccus sp. CR14]
MKTWKTLTEVEISPYLNTAQRDAVAARADLGTVNDPLTVSLAAIVERIRGEVRAHDKNILSADSALIPPELVRSGAYLVMVLLTDSIAAFSMTTAQEDLASEASTLLTRIGSGSFPVSIPGDPEVSPQVRTSFGPVVVSRRSNPLCGERLKGF